MSKIYLASSWRNKDQQRIVRILRDAGHEVYDFEHASYNDHNINGFCGSVGFHWSLVDKDWQQWDVKQYQKGLQHPVAERGFQRDIDALKWADTCVLLLPCGRSAHTEAGWMKGAGKRVFVMVEHLGEPELMYRLFDGVCGSEEELLEKLK
ncbi:hypothetical protein PRBRB14_26570 [Hallella multisaccharivorax DSM 17128]|uniref:Nucleoside 2-deoxyribosyltransferase n=1 Tax=Hallella multisaccharivorax DSM 17128 TaxID=688246 RepID=F8NCU0_9BACT|nr:hypothetical protein [Hallella multisaccharivorax]EGN58125.1 hypothetical protein Premu_2778 [Hallella multisaccharivorax DSM 17128]GJG31778.1 hypothetical protein PRBRB14_26570 [Hallella multisaccharivorax DSM 17128]